MAVVFRKMMLISNFISGATVLANSEGSIVWLSAARHSIVTTLHKVVSWSIFAITMNGVVEALAQVCDIDV
ncbi:hypothetical protein PILCRDRAFT_816254 [Piloderma croceum F 1598]|uniref:Uncharacterized protein n=1 Tax=Piloderma croceum (strain F 1598) TaxID=765440 RepID=A0A0C3BJ19_PILCF|nr:hypothetical protein PILCRDRAFT_816254 [Piloderma croceum F 1598]